MTSQPSPYLGRDHSALADLARELLLAGHLIDRSGMPHLIGRFGREGMAGVAIGEWMAASPVYTPRMQELLGFVGDDVATIFKGMQLDVGAPPEFMDFRYEVHDANHGEFHLDHCGALMDVEPMGDDYVTTMCHDIEDPTFDATAAATNPRAQVRPIHRPPRVPTDRQPHCAWSVTIDDANEPLELPAQAVALARSSTASVPLAERPAEMADDDGVDHYSGPVDPDLVMERFSSATLAAVCDEVALQSHLLARGFLVEVADLTDDHETRDIGARQLCGIAGLTSKRIASLLGVGADLDGVSEVLAVHPLFLPRTNSAATFERDGDTLTVWLGDSPALSEADGLSWLNLLVDHDDRGLRAAVQCVDARAQVKRAQEVRPGMRAGWTIRHQADAEPVDQPSEVTLTEFSTGSDFHFTRHI